MHGPDVGDDDGTAGDEAHPVHRDVLAGGVRDGEGGDVGQPLALQDGCLCVGQALPVLWNMEGGAS